MNLRYIMHTLENKGHTLTSDGLLDRILKFYSNDETGLSINIDRLIKGCNSNRPGDFIRSLNRSETHLHCNKIRKGGNKEYLDSLCKILLLTDIPIEAFVMPEVKMSELNFKEIYSSKNQLTTSTNTLTTNKSSEEFFEVLHVDSDDETDYVKHMDQYFGIVSKFIKLSVNRLYIFDYLHRLSYQNYSTVSTYSNRHGRIYELIDAHVFPKIPFPAHAPYVYRRVLAAPIHKNLNDFSFISENLSEFDAIKACIVKYSSFNLLKHIVETIEKEPPFEKQSYHSGFYCTSNPVRTYQFAISGTPENEFYLEELSKYNKGECRPDILIVGESNGRYKTGAHQYQKDFDFYFQTSDTQKFTLKNLFFIVSKLIDDLLKKVKAYYKESSTAFEKNQLIPEKITDKIERVEAELKVLIHKKTLLSEIPKCKVTDKMYV